MTNSLLERPTALDTAKVGISLLKLLLTLSEEPTAIALGAFLEPLLIIAFQKLEQQPTGALKIDDDDLPTAVAQAAPPKVDVRGLLSHFNIRTIEVHQESLLRLLRNADWASTQGGISRFVPGQPVYPADWFSAQSLPEALHNSTLLLRRDHDQIIAAFPAAKSSTSSVHSTPEHSVQELKPKLLQGDVVIFTSIWKNDISQDLIVHGIRLAPGPLLPGFLVTLDFGRKSYQHILIPDLLSSVEVSA